MARPLRDEEQTRCTAGEVRAMQDEAQRWHDALVGLLEAVGHALNYRQEDAVYAHLIKARDAALHALLFDGDR